MLSTISIILMLNSCDLLSQRVFYKPILQVENQKLNVQEFSKLLAKKLKNLDPLSAKDPVIIKKFKDQIVSDFIVDSLIETWFITSNQIINDAELGEMVLGVIKNYPSDSVFRTFLAEQDLSYSDWHNSLKISYKRQLLFKELQKNSGIITPDHIKNFYESNKDRFLQKESVLTQSILVSNINQTEVIKKLYKKTPFDKLLLEYSIESPKPASSDMTLVERDTLNDLEILFSSKKNELLGPVQMSEGFRLFKVFKKNPPRKKSLEEVTPQIKNLILTMHESARFSAWLDEQIKKYPILKNEAAVEAISVETRED